MALFGKTTPPREAENDRKGTSPAASAPVFGGPRSEEPSGRMEAKKTVIGPQVRIQGELSGDEDIVVEGKVEGKITVSKSLRIGQNAHVSAEVRAQNVVIAGRVTGNVSAVEKVELLPSGTLEGNIRAPKIVIAEGAQFKGSVDMTTKPAEKGKDTTPPALPTKA